MSSREAGAKRCATHSSRYDHSHHLHQGTSHRQHLALLSCSHVAIVHHHRLPPAPRRDAFATTTAALRERRRSTPSTHRPLRAPIFLPTPPPAVPSTTFHTSVVRDSVAEPLPSAGFAGDSRRLSFLTIRPAHHTGQASQNSIFMKDRLESISGVCASPETGCGAGIGLWQRSHPGGTTVGISFNGKINPVFPTAIARTPTPSCWTYHLACQCPRHGALPAEATRRIWGSVPPRPCAAAALLSDACKIRRFRSRFRQREMHMSWNAQ